MDTGSRLATTVISTSNVRNAESADTATNATSDATTNELVIDTTAPAAPTVSTQTSNDTTPVITGTATVGAGEALTVTVNGVTYTVGDGNLTHNNLANTWSLTIPAGDTLGGVVEGHRLRDRHESVHSSSGMSCAGLTGCSIPALSKAASSRPKRSTAKKPPKKLGRVVDEFRRHWHTPCWTNRARWRPR